MSVNGGDRLDISDFLDLYDPLQDSINDFVQLSLTDDGSSTMVSVDADGQGAGEAVHIATLQWTKNVSVEDVIQTGEEATGLI
ncbi:MAG: type I secretion C-terminal target domain-containing protein [Alphaproteobacteria bacterium]